MDANEKQLKKKHIRKRFIASLVVAFVGGAAIGIYLWEVFPSFL